MTSSCLSDKQARRTIGDADDETNLVMRELNDANATATLTLSIWFYRSDLLSAWCIEETLVWPITKAHSFERLELLANASTNGAKFFVTCGGHAKSDDFFKSSETTFWEAAIKVLENKNVCSALLKKIEEEGQAILAFGKPISALLNTELGALLLWYKKEANSAQVLKAVNMIKCNTIVAEVNQPHL